MFGALGETRTRTARATAPSRQRVYQFHHQSVYFKFTELTAPDLPQELLLRGQELLAHRLPVREMACPKPASLR